MSLSDAYEAVDETPFPTCKTCRWYEKLDADDRAFFDHKVVLVVDGGINSGRLLRACRDSGLEVSASSLRNHIKNHHRLVRGEDR